MEDGVDVDEVIVSSRICSSMLLCLCCQQCSISSSQQHHEHLSKPSLLANSFTSDAGWILT
jgi:hypothetical protein